MIVTTCTSPRDGMHACSAWPLFLNALTELPTVTFWPYFDTVTLKMYGNTVCSKKYGSKTAKNYGCQKLSRFRKSTKVCHRCSCFASFCTQAVVCLATGVRRKKNSSYL